MDTDADFADIEKNINNVIERIVDALRGYTDEVITVVNMMLSIQTNLKAYYCKDVRDLCYIFFAGG